MNTSPEIVSLEPIETFCLMAEGGPTTYGAAFQKLEEVVPLKGHKFYGVYNHRDGSYRACVQPLDNDHTSDWQLETFTIPGGPYAYKKIKGKHEEITKQIPTTFDELTKEHEVDEERPSIEFYRSLDEFRLYLPVKQ